MKTLSLVLMSVLSLSTLVGCGASKADPKLCAAKFAAKEQGLSTLTAFTSSVTDVQTALGVPSTVYDGFPDGHAEWAYNLFETDDFSPYCGQVRVTITATDTYGSVQILKATE